MLQMNTSELHVHFAFSSTFHVARKVLLYNCIIIVEIDLLRACDIMYKFL